MFTPGLTRLFLISCLLLTAGLPARSQTPETLPEALRKLLESIPTPRFPDSVGFPRSVIVMEGEASVRVPPDAARIRIAVVSEGASPTEAAQDNATRMSAVVEAIKQAAGDSALTSGMIEIRTAAVMLSPVYAVDQVPPRGSPRVSGYRASNSVQISVRDLDRRGPGFVASMFEQANKAGANEISGPEFLVLKEAKPLVEARVNAIEDARTKAETYAKALNVRLGRVLSVTEADRGHRPMPMMARAASPDASPPIETGTNEIAARVTVTWELKQD